jgi:hypothetical protein
LRAAFRCAVHCCGQLQRRAPPCARRETQKETAHGCA